MVRMGRRAAVVLLVVLLWPGVASSQSLDWSDLDRAIRDTVAAGDAPGAVVLVGQGDRVLYRKAIGSRAPLPAVEPMTPDTLFHIPPLTKPVGTPPPPTAPSAPGKTDLHSPLPRS